MRDVVLLKIVNYRFDDLLNMVYFDDEGHLGFP